MELEKSNEVVNFYPLISDQQTSKETNKQTNKQTNKEFINLNHFMGEKSCLIRSKKKNKQCKKTRTVLKISKCGNDNVNSNNNYNKAE